ncbi:MAG: hypothetical protein IJ524_08255 [Bacteroidales bacterium]|nr:hypothetical protein [Bacteroidales bacterium]
MAKQNNGINGGYQGTVGTVVGYNWRGQWCTRARPRCTNDPHTEKQTAARGWFTAAVRLASHMKAALRQGLHHSSLAQHMTEGNYFIRLNRQHFGWQDGTLTVDYGSLTVAEGPVAPVLFGSVETTAPGTVSVPFAASSAEGPASCYDTVHLYAYCPEARQGVLAPPVYRHADRVTLAKPRLWADAAMQLYGWVQDVDGHCSPSTYLGHL